MTAVLECTEADRHLDDLLELVSPDVVAKLSPADQYQYMSSLLGYMKLGEDVTLALLVAAMQRLLAQKASS